MNKVIKLVIESILLNLYSDDIQYNNNVQNVFNYIALSPIGNF